MSQPSLYPRPRMSAGAKAGIIVAAIVGAVLLLIVVLVIVLVFAMSVDLKRSIGSGISGPPDGCGGVIVQRAPGYTPPPEADPHC